MQKIQIRWEKIPVNVDKSPGLTWACKMDNVLFIKYGDTPTENKHHLCLLCYAFPFFTHLVFVLYVEQSFL